MVPTGNMMPIAIDAQDCMSALVYEEKAGSGPVWLWLLVLDLRCDKKWHHGSGEKGDILREREKKGSLGRWRRLSAPGVMADGLFERAGTPFLLG